MYTWSFAYNIDAIREWIFAQKRIKERILFIKEAFRRMKGTPEPSGGALPALSWIKKEDGTLYALILFLLWILFFFDGRVLTNDFCRNTC